jgi:pimeloyl-ACP methyl ester carboxylesterase
MLLRAVSPPAAAGTLRVVAGFDVVADLGHIRCPALVTHSRRSRITPLDEARRLAEGISGARLVVLDSANDMPLPGEPAFDELVRLIRDFVAQRDAG